MSELPIMPVIIFIANQRKANFAQANCPSLTPTLTCSPGWSDRLAVSIQGSNTPLYTSPCPALPCPAFPYHALLCPAFPCPALPFPALPCPSLQCTWTYCKNTGQIEVFFFRKEWSLTKFKKVWTQAGQKSLVHL